MSVARAAFIVPLTASATCRFDAWARYRGMLAVAVAASSAALQLVRRFPRASATLSWAAEEDNCSLKPTKRRERIG